MAPKSPSVAGVALADADRQQGRVRCLELAATGAAIREIASMTACLLSRNSLMRLSSGLLSE
jgi:hypothetical protein